MINNENLELVFGMNSKRDNLLKIFKHFEFLMIIILEIESCFRMNSESLKQTFYTFTVQ